MPTTLDSQAEYIRFGQDGVVRAINGGSPSLVADNTSGSHYTSSPWNDPLNWTSPSLGMSNASVADLIANGFNTVRVGVPIAVVMDAFTTGSPNTPSAMVTYISDELQKGYDQGLNLILVLGVQFPLYDPDVVLSQAVADGADYVLFRRAAKLLLTDWVARQWSPTRVAIDIWSEPSFIGDEAAGILKNYNTLRPWAGRFTLIVQGGNAGTVAGLADITPSNFGPNTIFSFGMYRPSVFTHQGYSTPEIAPLKWPPAQNTEGKAQVIADMTARVNANGSLSAGEKTARISEYTGYLNTYFDTPEDATYLAGQFTDVDAFMVAHSIPANRMMVYEYGVFRNVSGGSGAALADRVRWLTATRGEIRSRGLHDAVYQMRTGFGLYPEGVSSTIIPELAAALFP